MKRLIPNLLKLLHRCDAHLVIKLENSEVSSSGTEWFSTIFKMLMYDKKIQCKFDCLFRQTALQAFKPTFMRYRFLNTKKKKWSFFISFSFGNYLFSVSWRWLNLNVFIGFSLSKKAKRNYRANQMLATIVRWSFNM